MIRLAGCVLVDDDGILLLHRISRDWYELPGGKMKPGESVEDTAKRELLEELGVEIEIVKALGTKAFDEDGRTMEYNWLLATMDGTPVVGEPEVFDHFKRIPLDELDKHTLSPNMQNLAAQLRDGHVIL